jgi:hypothetical protein
MMRIGELAQRAGTTITYLHGDHLGWSLKPGGEPVFPEARYVTQAAEWEISAPYLGRAIAALDDLGVLDLLDGEEPVGDANTVSAVRKESG